MKRTFPVKSLFIKAPVTNVGCQRSFSILRKVFSPMKQNVTKSHFPVQVVIRGNRNIVKSRRKKPNLLKDTSLKTIMEKISCIISCFIHIHEKAVSQRISSQL